MPFEYHSNRNYSINSVKTYHNERRIFINNQAIPHSGVSWKEWYQARAQDACLYHVLLTAEAETHPSFKVDTQKNLWIDYGEGKGGSIIDLCMRLEGCTLQEAICRLGQTVSFDATYSLSKKIGTSPVTPWQPSGARRLIKVSDSLSPHLEAYLADKRYIDLNRARPFLKCICYEIRGRCYQAIGFANQSGGY